MPAPDQLGIGEVARRSGIPATTLRYYESIGVLPAVERIGGRRSYPPEVLAVLAVVSAARQAGLDLAAVRDIVAAGSSSPARRWRDHASRRRSVIRHTMDELERAAARLDQLEGCDCPDVATCGQRLGAESS